LSSPLQALMASREPGGSAFTPALRGWVLRISSHPHDYSVVICGGFKCELNLNQLPYRSLESPHYWVSPERIALSELLVAASAGASAKVVSITNPKLTKATTTLLSIEIPSVYQFFS
ncbi:hypothetical protein NDI39_31085, partial [Microcoleus sp. ZQ-A2]